MGRNHRQKKSSCFSIFGIFKGFCSPGRDDTGDEVGKYESITCPRYGDRDGWAADPSIDRKASDFIAKFHATQVSDPQTLAV